MATAIWTVTLDELANALRLSTQYGENNQFVVPLSSLSSSVVQQLVKIGRITFRRVPPA